MKKVSALILALIFALSAATTAFAVTTLIQCPYCGEYIEGEKAFNEHVSDTCPVVGVEPKYDDAPILKTCPYGCGAQFRSQTEYENHLEVCFDRNDLTLAEKVENFLLELDLREDVLGTVLNLLSKINFSDITVTIIGLLEKAVLGIIDAI